MKKLMLLGLISAFADCSETDAMRKFEKLGSSLHERLPFDIGLVQCVSSRPSERSFNGKMYVYNFQNTQDEQTETVQKEPSISLAIMGPVFSSNAEFVSISDRLEELRDSCFYVCTSLSRVRFGETSSLKRIGNLAFFASGLCEIHIPDNVVEIGSECFAWCKSLSRVTFGESSGLKRIEKMHSVRVAFARFEFPIAWKS